MTKEVELLVNSTWNMEIPLENGGDINASGRMVKEVKVRTSRFLPFSSAVSTVVFVHG